MRGISDMSRKEEIFEAPSFQTKYNDIKAIGDIGETEARKFWNAVFSQPMTSCEITEKDICKDIYGRTEEEFVFDIDISRSEIQHILKLFKTESWELLSVEEKEIRTQELMLLIAKELGIKNPPSIEFYEALPCDCGAYEPERNVISVNRNNLDDSQEIVNTIAHETRHAYQYQRAMNPENYLDFLYAYNFANYIAPYVDEDGYANFIDYQDQLIEAEARAFADLFRLEDANNE